MDVKNRAGMLLPSRSFGDTTPGAALLFAKEDVGNLSRALGCSEMNEAHLGKKKDLTQSFPDCSHSLYLSKSQDGGVDTFAESWIDEGGRAEDVKSM